MASGSYRNCLYASQQAGTAKNTFTTELQLNAGTDAMKPQAKITPDFWGPSPADAVGRGIHIVARGILSTFTTAPTYTWTVRGGAVNNISAVPVLLGSAAITTLVSQTNVIWELEGDIILEVLGHTALSSLRGVGRVSSPGISGGTGGLFANSAQPGLITNFDTTINNFINVNVACGTSNAANSIQLLQLVVEALN